MTLDRILQSQGFGTRRYCGDLVAAGLVEVNGELCEDPRAQFEVDGLRLTVDGEAWIACTKAYLMLNKPAGYECSQRPRHHPSVYNLLPVPLRQREVQAVGRLDHDTTGLLLLTDDGQFIHALKLAGIDLDRKVLADIAMNEGDAFKGIIAQAKQAIEKKDKATA